MKNIELIINKANVYDEVAKTTSYTGLKTKDDETAYDRIFTTDEDRMMLERFWVEACNGATEQFKPFLVSVNAQPMSHGVELENDYKVALELSESYDESLTGSVQTSLFSYFVALIVSKWFKFSNKEESGSYATDALGAIDDVMRKIYYRKKPKRVMPK